MLFSLVVVNTFSEEIDRGLSYLCYIAFSVGCYYGFVVRTDYGTGEFISEAVKSYGILKYIMSGIFVLIDALITV